MFSKKIATLVLFGIISTLPKTCFAYGGGHRVFHEREWVSWRGGRWYHGNHGGIPGWWWIVDGAWHFFPRPVYPYPAPIVQPTIVIQSQAVAPPPPPMPPLMLPPAPPTMAVSQAPQAWYFCKSAQGYYPYVSSCPGGWASVPATPTQ